MAAKKQSKARPYLMRIFLKHPTMNPALITKHLGVMPSAQWMVGDVKKSRPGGLHKSSYWGHMPKSSAADINVALEVPLRILEKARAFMRRFTREGDAVVIVSWALSPDLGTGQTFEPDVLRRLGRLNVALGADVNLSEYLMAIGAAAPAHEGRLVSRDDHLTLSCDCCGCDRRRARSMRT